METEQQVDERFMSLALAQAREAAAQGEVPVGAVITDPQGRVIGRGHNLTQMLNDVTAHAEMQAITAAAQWLGGKYLSECTLYVTVEPCIMCAGAIGWSQLGRVVIGAPDPKRGYSSVMASHAPFHPKTQIVTGVCAEQCAALMSNFFAARRK
ncbi:MAG: nucleoside deaminase [Muribaculaceae bacterium]|nr:nucleoside deaminase [Muribaculaceae bacterium]